MQTALDGSGYTFRYADIDITHSGPAVSTGFNRRIDARTHTRGRGLTGAQCAYKSSYILARPVRTHYDSASAASPIHTHIPHSPSRASSRRRRCDSTVDDGRREWAGRTSANMRCMRTRARERGHARAVDLNADDDDDHHPQRRRAMVKYLHFMMLPLPGGEREHMRVSDMRP